MQKEFEEYQELSEISAALENASKQIAESPLYTTYEMIEKVITEVEKSFSGSCLGYHAYVYYKNLQIPPAGEHFNTLLGISHGPTANSKPWVEYSPDFIKQYILEHCGNPDLASLKKYEQEIRKNYERYRANIISILSQENFKSDEFLRDNLKTIKSKNLLAEKDILNSVGTGKMLTQDHRALSQGPRVPPHIQLVADIIPIKFAIGLYSSLSQITNSCADHIARKQKRMKYQNQGNRIFIGHGQSLLWYILKDFLSSRLKLTCEEFNRISPAGIATTERLNDILDNSAFAFLIMTAEDERADGSLQARMNVIHEAGLFQGRLGFKRAIILLEEGCEEFSNIVGLGEIRFPQGKIEDCFEKIRSVLEREQII